MYHVACLNFFPNYTIVGGFSVSENRELNPSDSAEGDNDVQAGKSLVNPLTPKISSLILLTVCPIVLGMLLSRMWYWIN